MWVNLELALEENILSKWHEQGALYSESTGSKFHSEIDRKRYEINMKGSTYVKKEAQYIQISQLESFHQIIGPLH